MYINLLDNFHTNKQVGGLENKWAYFWNKWFL